MLKKTYAERRAKLSRNALRMLERIEQGKFYKAYEDEPATMGELKEAGLVYVCMRVEVVRACYVPACGYTPYREEKFSV